jgi:hypothetical protein
MSFMAGYPHYTTDVDRAGSNNPVETTGGGQRCSVLRPDFVPIVPIVAPLSSAGAIGAAGKRAVEFRPFGTQPSTGG